jgi:hypothetical protein
LEELKLRVRPSLSTQGEKCLQNAERPGDQRQTPTEAQLANRTNENCETKGWDYVLNKEVDAVYSCCDDFED